MSTRANITLDFPHELRNTYLYRHHDGYPAFNGQCIFRALSVAEGRLKSMRSNADEYDFTDDRIWAEVKATFLSALFRAGRSVSTRGDEPTARQSYEHTHDLHGDIEYNYTIRPDGDVSLGVDVASRPDWNTSVDEWAHDGTPYTREELGALVNDDRKAMNERILDRHPDATGEDLIPLVTHDGTETDTPAVPATA